MAHKIRVGIVGMGRSGVNNHASAMEALSDMYEIAAICDPDENRRTCTEGRYGCRAYSDIQEMLADPEVELVVVATPNHMHAANSIDALKAGKHVVCEKPIAVAVSEADEMIETSRRAGKVLTVFQSCRFTPDFLKVKEVIDSGKLGRVVYIRNYFHRFRRRYDWQTLKSLGGGQLLNNGSHFVDRAVDLFGESEPEIFCDVQKTTSFGDADDHIKIMLRGSDAPTIDVEVTDAGAFPDDGWLVMGTLGGLKGSGSSLKWRYFNPGDVPQRKVSMAPDVPINEDIPWIEESWESTSESIPAKVYYYRELYRSLRENAPIPVTPESSRRVLAILQKCAGMSGI